MKKAAEKGVDIHAVVKILRQEVKQYGEPIVTEIAKKRRDPFHVLISTILSLRTKDEVTRAASKRLLDKAATPQGILRLTDQEIEKIIYPVGFYKTKARTLKQISADILEKYGGSVPDDLDELLKLKGVGRKTANLVITWGFGKPGICVDTHVHRISNRLGYVKTKSPNDTEMVLREKLPPEYWLEYNDLLVIWGQNVCRPISPFCSKCAIYDYCRRVGVNIHR